jgi:steroid delta-isomerase-like uncharacterized protein
LTIWTIGDVRASGRADFREVIVNAIAADQASANAARQRALVQTLQHEGQISRIAEFVHADVVDHMKGDGMPDGIAGVEMILGAIRAGFPDHNAQVLHMIAEGDLVATHKTFTGTHTGEFFGTPPTGKRATIRVMDFVRYRDGKVAEHWNVIDFAGLMRQLQD